MYKYHIIKESNLDLDILPENKVHLMQYNGFENFTGSTHREYREYGQIEHVKTCPNSTFGKEETKEGVTYWVLPYPYNPTLDIDRVEGESVVSQTLTLEEYNNFGFDVIEYEII